jgi:hypothetical protein
MGTLHEDQFTYLNISRLVLLKKNFLRKNCRENENKFNIQFFLEKHAVDELM